MTRKPDWEARLSAYLARVHDRAHSYGRHDCLIDCANAVKAQTGRDFARGHRRKYHSATGSVRYLRGLGFDSAEAMIDSILEERPVGFARRGDIVLNRDGVPGICIGADALFIGDAGRVRLHRADWTKAWSV